ncbi:MAG: MFS transporter [Anaerolineales bacterium]|nr:MFS transporter [Anaerolineales bacterium]
MTTIEARERPSTFAVFRNRNFTFLWLGQLVSTIGSALTSLAASIVVFRLTGSALSVGLMLIATSAPTLVLGLIAGVFVDRYDRKRIMIIADVARAVVVILIPFLIPYGIAWLYLLVMMTSVIGQFFDPAHSSVVPEVASDEELAAANSFMAISAFGSTAVGFAAAGLIASKFPIEWAFYLDGLTFIISALCILVVKIAPLEVEGETTIRVIGKNLRAGMTFLVNNTLLRSLLMVSIPILLGFGLWNSLLLPFAERALHASEFEFGLQEAMTSIGFVIASLLMAKIGGRLREGQWIAISYLGMALAAIVYSRVTSIPLAIGLVMIIGFMNAPAMISGRLLIQRNTERGNRGRVMSVFAVIKNTAFLLGMAAAGFADLVDIRVMMLISALIILFSGVLTLSLPGLRQSAEEWRRAASLLRAAPAIPSLSVGRAATVADFDALLIHLPVFTQLNMAERTQFIEGAQIRSAPAGSSIIRRGETGEEAFFILSGRAVAGISTSSGDYRSLSVMAAGDFFGEIAALMGVERTADVVAEEETTLLQVPAENLKRLLDHPRLRYLLLSKLTERLSRTHVIDLPRLAGFDQDNLRELRMTPIEAEEVSG